MSYWQLDAIFLGVTFVVAVLAIVLVARRAPDAGARVASIGIALAVLLVVTAVFDNVMIGVGLVGYDAAHISGAFIGVAPIEDFAYPVAAVILLPSLWALLGRRRARVVER